MKIYLVIGIVIILAISVVLINFSSLDSYKNTIRIAFFPNIGHAVPIIGIENGIFAEGMGNTDIQTRLFDSGPQAIESLFANSIDMAYVGPGPAINGFLKSESKNIIILAGAASGGSSFIVHSDSGIESDNNLAGKKIAAPQIANTQDVSLRHYLFAHGFKTAEHGGDVFVLNVANSEIYTLFTKGDIDAAWVPEPWATIFVRDLGGKRLFYEESLWVDEQFASVLLIARSDFVKENPTTIEKWLDLHDKTVSWINSNPEKTETIFNQFMEKEFNTSFSNVIIHEAFSNIKITSDPIKDSIVTFAKRADSLGYLGREGYSLDGIFYDQIYVNSLEEKDAE